MQRLAICRKADDIREEDARRLKRLRFDTRAALQFLGNLSASNRTLLMSVGATSTRPTLAAVDREARRIFSSPQRVRAFALVPRFRVSRHNSRVSTTKATEKWRAKS